MIPARGVANAHGEIIQVHQVPLHLLARGQPYRGSLLRVAGIEHPRLQFKRGEPARDTLQISRSRMARCAASGSLKVDPSGLGAAGEQVSKRVIPGKTARLEARASPV